MSTGSVRISSDVAVLAPGSRAQPRPHAVAAQERPGMRLAAFAALALYGTLRWGTLISPAPSSRLLGLVAIAVALVWLGPRLSARSRIAFAALGVGAALLVVLLCGLPPAWLRHLRLAAGAQALGQGVSALPRILVPYLGLDPWVRLVILLAAGILLLDSALMLVASWNRLTQPRRFVVAVPLIALAVVPATLVRPQLPYLQGALLFGLVATFLWVDTVPRPSALAAVGLGTAAAIAGMILAPGIERHTPWLNYEALAAKLAPAHLESFDWTQGYGPLRWPRRGRDVLEVQAARPDYWKSENLDAFDGRGWVLGSTDSPAQQQGIDPSAVARWSEQLQVTIRAMKTNVVIAAGSSAPPLHVPGAAAPNQSPGTWVSSTELGPGDSYEVTAYDPRPSAAELSRAGTAYPLGVLEGYLSLTVPERAYGLTGTQPVTFAPFHGGGGAAAPALARSPYARAYALAQRLANAAPTPYAFATRVQRFLGHGFVYDETPPVSRYPLATFLFSSHRGYCQQFAGAMALLLRMGGVPARVATGFTPGTLDTGTHRWVVSDLDAHAWVEAWFPHYGWVRFDPTPAAAPARGGKTPLPTGGRAVGGASSSAPAPRRITDARGSAPGSPAARHGGGAVPLLGFLLVVLALAPLAVLRFHPPAIEQQLDELERAFRRAGRPLGPGTTLAGLEHLLRADAGAQDYVRTLRLHRYAGAAMSAPPSGRRALRAWLRRGLGARGAARSLWALPPRVHVRFTASRGIHSR